MQIRKYVRQVRPIQENKQKKLLVMGDTTAAYDMEKVIVSAAGGKPFVSKLIPNSDEVGKKIINNVAFSKEVVRTCEKIN